MAGAIAIGLLAIACGGETERPGPTPEAPEAARPASSASDTRNVLLITIDTLRADALGAYGSARDASPRIDRLAAEGVLFEQCAASAPITLPSHASILTGMNPYNHGARANGRYRLATRNVTLAERLLEAGFATGAETAASVLDRTSQIDQGFVHYRDVDAVDAAATAPVRTDMQLITTRDARDITKRGIEFVRRHREEPFFLWLHYYDPHLPYDPPPDLAQQHPESPYHAEVAHVDRQVGRVIDALANAGLTESTLVVVTSDHGEGLGEHGEDSHASFVYESTMRIPLVFRGPPDLAAGSRIATPVRAVDIAPTILDWLGLPPLHQADGRTLLPLLRGNQDFGRRTAYGESIDLKIRFGTSILRSVREGPWKYIHKVRPALYNLDQDPDESTNLIDEEPARADALRQRLRELLANAAPAPEDATVASMDERTAQQLVALGYVASGPAPIIENELETLDVSGVDPDDLADDMRLYFEGFEHLWQREPERALAILEPLAERNPRSSQVLEGLLDAHLQLGNADEALALLRRGIDIDPGHRRYWHNLFEVLLKVGKEEEARKALRSYHERWPCDVDARIQWAALAAKHGDQRARFEILEAGVGACDAPPELLNDLAYALATAPDPSLRDGERAVRLAEQVAAALPDEPTVLDTLAVAYAEAGRKEEALVTLTRALEIAQREGRPEALVSILRDHAALLERNEAIVE